jgi:hypothetical protein
MLILGIDPATRIALGVTAANTAVLLLWKIKPLIKFMNKWFVHRPLEGMSGSCPGLSC